MPNKYKDSDVPDNVTRLYQWRHVSKRWDIVGYKCPYCYKHYHSIRQGLFTHVENCTGPKEKPSLED